MDKDEEIGFTDKAKMYAEKHTPGTSKHSLTGASYEIKDVGPFDIDLSGAPRNKALMLIVGIIGTYLVVWFWYGWVFEGVKDFATFEYMSMIAFWAGISLAFILVSTLIDFHKGSFNQYIMIIELRIRSMLGKPLKRVEFKVIKAWELYNPTFGGFWRSTAERDKEDDDLKALDKEDKKDENPKFKPVDMKADGMPYYELEGKRFTSMRDMQDIMKMALIEGEVIETKDEIKEILNLKRRFAELAEKIRLPFVVTMCKCDSKGGRIFPIFTSDHSMFGGSSGLESYVEFRNWTLPQRTWAGIVSKDNVRAGVGEGVEIAMYKHYEVPSEQLQLSGNKEEKMYFAPLIHITASDAQAEKMMNDFRSNKTRESPIQQDVIDASVVYDNSVADEVFEMLKLVISRLKRKEKSEDVIKRDQEFDNKNMVFQGLEKALKTGQAGKPSRFSNIKLFSNQSIRYLVLGFAFIASLFFIAFILHNFVGVDFGWIFGELPVEELPEEEWGAIAQIGLGWLK